MEVEVDVHPKYKILFDPPKGMRILILIGGRGAMKTHYASVGTNFHVLVKKKRIQILRDEATRIKNSIMTVILEKFDNFKDAFIGEFSRTENTIKNNDGVEVVFTQGFRASSNAKTSNMKGVAKVDIGIVEEMADIRDELKFNHWKSSIREDGSFIVLILNTPDIHHWLIKRYFYVEPLTTIDYPQFNENELEGYSKIIPKKSRGVEVVQATFRDNEHLPQEIKDEYEDYGIRESNSFDLHYFLTEIEGHTTTGLKGAVYKGWKRISLQEYNSLDYNKYYYLDWGTNDECAIGEVKIYNKIMMVKGLHYKPTTKKDDLVLDVALFLASKGFTNEIIICDSSQPRSIIQLQGYERGTIDDFYFDKYPQLAKGFSTVGVPKPPGSVMDGIRIIQGYEVYVVEDAESEHIWDEYVEYRWELDKDGKSTGQPIDKKNHHMDGIRYVGYCKDNL